MELLWVGTQGAERRDLAELPDLLRRYDGFAWLDVPVPDEKALRLLREIDVPEAIVTICAERSLVPKVWDTDGYLTIVVHSLDEAGHLLEIDHVVTQNLLVTVHGPITAGVDLALALRETDAVRARIAGAASGIEKPLQAVRAVVGALATTLEQMLAETARKGGGLDRRLREGATGDPEGFLEELFSVRHELVTVANRAAQTRSACESVAALSDEPDLWIALAERFGRLRSLCDGEKEFLQGVLDYYESLVNTKMNIAMERLAVIAAVALPITAIGGILGMNTIVNLETDVWLTVVVLVAMVALAAVMLRWAKKQGWW